jgi:putative N6-adenine-specific DNA methylase
MLNPPYGERLEPKGATGRTRLRGATLDADRLDADPDRPKAAARGDVDAAEPDNRDLAGDFFARLAAHWKRAYAPHPGGWTAFVLSPDMKLPSAMRLKESRRIPMWNGPIECRLFRFELVRGSARGGNADSRPLGGDADA